MKSNIIILTPVYNDWKNLEKLLKKINKIFLKKLKSKFELIVVNDCSQEIYNYKKLKLKTISKINFISLYKNVGSQRAIAIGIRYLSNIYRKKNFKTIIIDSDGQDNPNIISKLLAISKQKPSFSIAINRGQRKESNLFRIFYELYCLIIRVFYFKKIRFGNFSLINSIHLKKIGNKSDLWCAFPPTLSKNINQIVHLTVNREKRYGGESKMNFFGLIRHAWRVFSALRFRVLISSIIYIFLSYVIFYEKNQMFFFLIFFSLLIFNIINFSQSFKNKDNFTKNYKKAKIRVL